MRAEAGEGQRRLLRSRIADRQHTAQWSCGRSSLRMVRGNEAVDGLVVPEVACRAFVGRQQREIGLE